MIIKKEAGEENVIGGRKKKKHLGKYFNCLLRFGAQHKRSICAPQSRKKGETQMVLRPKQWKPIHELGKVKPIYLTIYLLCVSVWVCECIGLVVCGCSCFYTWEDCMCAFDCSNWSPALKSQKSWEDRILWTAYKMCNEYLSLFIFARFRYFNVSSPLLLWVSVLVVRFLDTQQRAKGGGESGCLRMTVYLTYNEVRCPFSCHENNKCLSNHQKKNSIWISTKCVWDDLLKVQITPTLALSFRTIKVNVTRESREHSFSQDNMENFTAFIPF